MGVAGCGKSSVGKAIAEAIDGAYLEGDEYHPPANIEKMRNGIALEDADRWPWLSVIGKEMAGREGTVVGGCSALKRKYREHLAAAAGEPILFVYLDGSPELIESRMAKRAGHFMPTSLLRSQFEALEVPDENEPAIAVQIDGTVPEIVTQFLSRIREISPTNCK